MSWQQPTPTGYVTQVCYSLGTPNSHRLEIEAEFMYRLRQQCQVYYCALSVNFLPKQDGVIEVTVFTELMLDVVFALIANFNRRHPDFTFSVTSVPTQQIGSITSALSTLTGSPVRYG